MNLSDGDFEFIFSMYDNGMELLTQANDKKLYAESTINTLVDYGFEVKRSIKEISEHCEYLSDALDSYLEMEEEDEDVFGDYNEDDWDGDDY